MLPGILRQELLLQLGQVPELDSELSRLPVGVCRLLPVDLGPQRDWKRS